VQTIPVKVAAPQAPLALAAQPPKPPIQSEPLKPLETAAGAEQAPKPTATKTVKVSFALFEPEAKQVSLCGDFNGWASGATPMKRHDGGQWETTVALAPGRHEYKFVVDGNWIPNPMAHEHVWNQHGTLNSVIEVRA
jgi:1,4-alpha-glucan branching enzyme